MTSLLLSTALAALLAEEAFEVRLQVRLIDAQLLLLRRPEEKALWLEIWPADGGSEAGKRHAEFRERMAALGLRRRRQQTEGPRAFGLELPFATTAATVATRLDELLAGLCIDADALASADLSIASQRSAPPENPRLREAMRAAASTQDGPTRQRLYAALVNATLLVPLAPHTVGLAEPEQQPLTLDEGSLMAFSDWNALRHWQATGHPFGLVHGTDLFAHAAERQAGVSINPQGTVGGVLYPAEVKMMAEAVRSYIESQRRGG